ncbi:MAG: hypothetical protein KDA45_01525 [Planctomycetales bacterium]|nr:hypothetical protein [Planctomycetales bacterium]
MPPTHDTTPANLSLPSNSSRRWPKPLIALTVVYAAWLGWLAYVAWVNVQAGNQ